MGEQYACVHSLVGIHWRAEAYGPAVDFAAVIHEPLESCGAKADSNHRSPSDRVRAGHVERHAAEPGSDEGADLMAKKGQAEEGIEVLQPKHPRDETAHQRRHAEPHESHGRREHERRSGADRHRQERGNGQRAQQVDEGEQALLLRRSERIWGGSALEYIH